MKKEKMTTKKDSRAETICDGKYDNLAIVEDTDEDENGNEIDIAVLLYIPNMDTLNEHDHIIMTKQQALVLRDWLNVFLKADHEKNSVYCG